MEDGKATTRLNTFVRNFDKEFTALLRRNGPKGTPDVQAEVFTFITAFFLFCASPQSPRQQ